AETKMLAETERQVGIGLAVQADFLRILEHGLVEISGQPAEGYAAARRDRFAVHLGSHRANPADVRQRHKHAEEFLPGMANALWVLSQVLEGFRILRQVSQN